MWYLMIFVLLFCYLGFFFGFKKWGIDALFCFAIGGAVNANFFHAQSYPIYIGGLRFGIDAIIYTLFAFCCIVAFLRYSKKQAMLLVFSSIGAIAFAGISQFVADWSVNGSINTDILISAGSFFVSILATYIAILVAFYICDILKRKGCNVYANIAIGIFIISIINSLIYYGLSTLMLGGINKYFWNILLASYIAKIISVGVSVFVYFLIEKFVKCKNKASNLDKKVKG